ncbi:hypothetical protein H4R35_004190 [Dimargaris xerosporica]|nr:hypothetical protein H4R35_004190 [Dimargaris xerosporica]
MLHQWPSRLRPPPRHSFSPLRPNPPGGWHRPGSLYTSSRVTRAYPNHPFAKSYDPRVVEQDWYEWWESQHLFVPQTRAAHAPTPKPLVMLAPPPNVTGSLHIGHALTFTLQDAIARWARMQGRAVHWIPGTDHAGIATQTVVEKQLMSEQGLTRHDVGRDAFVDRVWQWKTQYGDRIKHQQRVLGVSMNWDAEYFTMDPACSQTVHEAFVRLHRAGLIYRDTRIINWCCRLQTAISDIEVEYEAIGHPTHLVVPGQNSPIEFGWIYHIAYPLVNPTAECAELIVATTRPETILGDVALAIHPDDPRYKKLHNQRVKHPILDRELPLVCDGELVDVALGTGVVKVTPGHDANDYQCGKRHGLPVVTCFARDGTMTADCGVASLVGVDRFDARALLLEHLQQRGALRKKQVHPMRVARCGRSQDIIEPMVQPQWFVDCRGMARAALRVVETQQLRFFPKTALAQQEWTRWLTNIQDWCISRQLWWGHRIPAYWVTFDSAGGHDQHNTWLVAADQGALSQMVDQHRDRHSIPNDVAHQVTQDPDVLDTWFSSALLPLSVMGLGSHPRAFDSLLETGQDILFFWVARMVMLSVYLTGQNPFDSVLLHPMVRDAQGRKMSKSLGNVIDPLQVIHGASLAELQAKLAQSFLSPQEQTRSREQLNLQYPQGIVSHGADALRLTLTIYTQQSHQINMDVKNVATAMHFCNKLWNLLRFTLGKLDGLGSTLVLRPAVAYQPQSHRLHRPEDLTSPSADTALWQYLPTMAPRATLIHRFILSRLFTTVHIFEQEMDSLRLFAAADAVQKFILNDLCDTYLEFAKPLLAANPLPPATSVLTAAQVLQVLVACIDQALRLLHPFMPFVTEELWQQLVRRCDVYNPIDSRLPRTAKCAQMPLNSSPPAVAVEPAPMPSIMVAAAPQSSAWASLHDPAAEADMEVLRNLLSKMRHLRNVHDIPSSQLVPFTLSVDGSIDYQLDALLEPLRPQFCKMARASTIATIDTKAMDPSERSSLEQACHSETAALGLKVLVPQQVIRDIQHSASQLKASGPLFQPAAALARLEKKRAKFQRDFDSLSRTIRHERYQTIVPMAVQEKDRRRLERFRQALATVGQEMEVLRAQIGPH